MWGHLLGPSASLPASPQHTRWGPRPQGPPPARSPGHGGALRAGSRRASGRAPRLPPGPARPCPAGSPRSPAPASRSRCAGRSWLRPPAPPGPARPATEQPAGRGGAWRRPARAWPRPPGLSGAPGPPPLGCGAPAGPARVVPQTGLHAGGTPEVFLASLHPPPSNILRLSTASSSTTLLTPALGSRGCPHSTVNKGMGIRVCSDFYVTCTQPAPREWSTRSLYT